MNPVAVAVATFAFLALAVLPAHAQAQKPDKAGAAAEKEAPSHQTAGVVKKVDRTKGTVTLAHEAVPSLKWPAMTMAFSVKDQPLLDKLQPGAKVEFRFVQQGKDYVITSVK